MRRGVAAVLCVCVVLGLPAGVSAQPAVDKNEQEGKSKFEAGLGALKKGDVRGALALFQLSLKLNTSTGALLNIAYCEEKLGRLASASDHYKVALRLLPETDESVAIVQARMAVLESRIPTLRIGVDKGAPPGTAVLLGEQELEAYVLDTDMRLDPGKYTITAHAPGHDPKSYEVILGEGQKETITVAPAPKAPGAVSPASAPPGAGHAPPVAGPLTPKAQPGAVPPAPTAPSPLWTAGFVTLGVAGAAVITGAVTGGLALGKRQDLDDRCPDPQSCVPTWQSLHADGRIFGDISTTALAIAGAAAAGGTVMLLVASRLSRSKPGVGLAIGPGALSVRGRF